MLSNAKFNKYFKITFIYVFLIIGAIISIMPFFHLVMTSFKTYQESIAIPMLWFPKNPNIDAFKKLFSQIPFMVMFFNTVFVTFFVVVFQVIFSAMAGFSLVFLRLPARKTILMLFLVLLMVPAQVYILPQFILVQKLGFTNTLAAIILPLIPSAFGTFMFRQAYAIMPASLYEASVLDGANPFHIFLHVMLPLSKPTCLALGVLSALHAWNSLLWPLIVNSSQNKYTLAVGISMLVTDARVEYPIIMAGALLTLLPMVILFLLLKKYLFENTSYFGNK